MVVFPRECVAVGALSFKEATSLLSLLLFLGRVWSSCPFLLLQLNFSLLPADLCSAIKCGQNEDGREQPGHGDGP